MQQEKAGLQKKNMQRLQENHMNSILTMIEKQSEIIKMQSEIIDILSLELLQGGVLTESDLKMIEKAAKLQKTLEE